MNQFHKQLTQFLTRDFSLNDHDHNRIQETNKQKSNRFAKRINSQASVDPIVNIDFRLKTFYKPNKQYKFTGSCFKNDFNRTTKINSTISHDLKQTKNNFIFKQPAPTLQSKFIVDVKTNLLKNTGKKKIFTRKNRVKTIPNLIDLQDYLNQKKVQYKRQIQCQFIRIGEAHLLPLIEEKKGKVYIRALHKTYQKRLKIASKRQGQIFFHPEGDKNKFKKKQKKSKKLQKLLTQKSSPRFNRIQSESRQSQSQSNSVDITTKNTQIIRKKKQKLKLN